MELAVLVTTLNRSVFIRHNINEFGVILDSIKIELDKHNSIRIAEKYPNKYCYSLDCTGHNWGYAYPITQRAEPFGNLEDTLAKAYRDWLVEFQEHIEGGATSCYSPKKDEQTVAKVKKKITKILEDGCRRIAEEH